MEGRFSRLWENRPKELGLNLVVQQSGPDWYSRMYSLCRIDLSKSLFYPSTKAAEAKAKTKKKAVKSTSGQVEMLKSLPAPMVNLQASPCDSDWPPFFSLLNREAESSILFGDTFDGATAVYDIDRNSVVPIPGAGCYRRFDPIFFPMARPLEILGRYYDARRLYVMEMDPYATEKARFEILSYFMNDFNHSYQVRLPPNCMYSWFWESLPSPPFMDDHAYHRSRSSKKPVSYTTIDGGSTFCVSTGVEDLGTYAFDTTKDKWRQAGGWLLPFSGRAEHVPELNLWFGLEADSPHRLCALDLSSMATTDSSCPAVQQSWDDLMDVPESWLPYKQQLVHLGSGSFCIAKFFRTFDPSSDERKNSTDPEVEEEFAVLTGLEVWRGEDGDGLRMTKHRSRLYRFQEQRILQVL